MKNKTFLSIKDFIKNNKRIFIFLLSVFAFVAILPEISDKYLLEVPKSGGHIAEIEIGHPPRFINPVLATTDADKDLLPLIYSSLLKKNNDGKIIPGTASYKLSEDKKKYTISLDKDIMFSDGKSLTADDVIFTIKKIQDPFIRSPYDVQWLDVSIEKVDDYTIEISLLKEYAQFENTLASLYIMPKHLWFDIPPSEFPFSDLNRKPIGSGPYIVNSTIVDNNEKIKKYTLTKNNLYKDPEIFIENISFYYFGNYNDYEKSLIFSDKKIIKNIFSVSSELVNKVSSKESYTSPAIIRLPSSRFFGIFINKKNNPLLANISLRKTISLSIDRANIINNTLQGYAQNTLPNTSKKSRAELLETELKNLYKNFTLKTENNKKILIENKSKKAVVLKMAILESSEFKNISQNIKDDLSKIGIDLSITTYKETDLVNNVLRDREFELLLFGYQVENIKPDLYYFFHSSQTLDPGINISGFSNKEADQLILELRKNISQSERDKKNIKLNTLVSASYLYIPLYSPDYLYITDTRIRNFKKKSINSREERFEGIEKWYAQTEKILPIFNTEQ